MKKRSLTGIKPTGSAHLGNYLGMIEPAIELTKTHDCFYFIANYHALTGTKNANQVRDDTYRVAAQFLAFGLDPDQCVFFRQSDVPEVTELSWLLSCCVSMGDLTRAHAYKAAKDKNEEGSINLGVFSYPVLMAADILLYDADIVPVGKDQVQHLEMARAIAQRFNHYFGPTLKEPLEFISNHVAVVPGIDGRKMSKSYNNGIEPLASAKEVKKQVMAIVTDSKNLEDVKDPDQCHIFNLYKLLANADETQKMAALYRAGGYGYGHAKMALLDVLERKFSHQRKAYEDWMSNTSKIEDVLKKGAVKAKAIARPVLDRTRKACGIT